MEYAKKMEVRALVCAPIVYQHEFLGVTAAENPCTKRAVIRLNHQLMYPDWRTAPCFPAHASFPVK